MKVHLNQIPPEGLHLSGVADPEELDLRAGGDILSADPLQYELDLGLSGGGLFATGRLSASLDMRCVSCLQSFRYRIEVPHFAMQTELTGGETVDLTPFVREDTLLALPAHPRCDWDGATVCPGPPQTTEGAGTGETKDDRWSGLDQLKL
jgi:uncharacterized metal-binding protein YceD (DUF177 family)